MPGNLNIKLSSTHTFNHFCNTGYQQESYVDECAIKTSGYDEEEEDQPGDGHFSGKQT